jgi:hypothetical protein
MTAPTVWYVQTAPRHTAPSSSAWTAVAEFDHPAAADTHLLNLRKSKAYRKAGITGRVRSAAELETAPASSNLLILHSAWSLAYSA